MGRHKKMGAAETTSDNALTQSPRPYAQAEPARVRRLTMTTLGTVERKARFEQLRQLSI